MTELSLNWAQVQDELKGFVFKRVRDKTLTEDIVHDVFLKIQNKIQHVRETEKLFGWIYQITRNTIIDHYRKNKKQISLKDIDWESSPANFNDCVSNAISELIPTLPDKYRIPLEMSELQNMSQLEVAEKLDLSYPAAKSRVQRARQLLKDKLDEILIIKTDGYGNVVLCHDKGLCH
ncbi:MAG TPA: sigma-70 family RNA polymerase sigma factor [Chryseolinea sp.]|nr:sigma-70 family RNA polymerase sigma factor [Chryseolinea sp.]